MKRSRMEAGSSVLQVLAWTKRCSHQLATYLMGSTTHLEQMQAVMWMQSR